MLVAGSLHTYVERMALRYTTSPLFQPGGVFFLVLLP